jgi:D-sedoheptulose 7-phosphate isomerase
MRQYLLKSIDDSIRAIEQLKEPAAVSFMERVAEMLAVAFQQGRKVIIAGNGGSLCDASHFAEELTGYFRNKRKVPRNRD